MSELAPLLVERRGSVACLTLNRPAKRNALNTALLRAMRDALQHCAADPAVRIVQLSAAGNLFCAGADLEEMRAQVGASEDDNRAHAQQLAALLGELDGMPKPTVARVNGDGYGGALGLIAACDVVVAADDAHFAFSEVRLGLIPAVISPFVLAKISAGAAARYFLTAETLSAMQLQQLGLVHEVVPRESLDRACAGLAEALLQGAPLAQAAAKRLIREYNMLTPRPEAAMNMASRLAQMRVQAEAREGVSAFFDKRKPGWRS